jgi:hypothetical protein
MVPANGHYAKRIILILEKTLVTTQSEGFTDLGGDSSLFVKPAKDDL